VIDTEMMASQRETIAATLPLKRLGTSEEVAAAVVMVATNAYMTGQTVHVNGGRQFN
jgi:3-oxoacyl-[acyl-carrier protein] reductase